MISYNIDIQYPISIDGSDTALLQHQFDNGVLYQFDNFKWWQYRTLQLQVTGAKTTFTVMTADNTHTIRFTLLTQNGDEHIELKMESDLVVLFEKKDLFGLMTRKIKEYIGFERLSLAQAREYLVLFLQQDLAALEHVYRTDLQQYTANA